jgi:steroid 5-alpha reductase family enzyme
VTPAERASEDAYVRRMRPTFGYIMAFTWLAQMGAIAWVIVADPVQANLIITAMTSLGTIWSVGLSVLGIYVYKRSEDKRMSARTDVRSPDGALTSKTGR